MAPEILRIWHISTILEDCQLPGFLLLLPFVMQAQDCFVHDPGEKKHLLDFFFFWNPAQLIMQRNGNFGFLFRGWHTLFVSKLNSFIKL
jgi:hypothetical protein